MAALRGGVISSGRLGFELLRARASTLICSGAMCRTNRRWSGNELGGKSAGNFCSANCERGWRENFEQGNEQLSS